MPDPASPQSFNRYSYCLNNPLKYIDPSGHDPENDPWDPYYELIKEYKARKALESLFINTIQEGTYEERGIDLPCGNRQDILTTDYKIVIFDTIQGNKWIAYKGKDILINKDALDILFKQGKNYQEIVNAIDSLGVNYVEVQPGSLVLAGLIFGIGGTVNKDLYLNQGAIISLAKERVNLKGGLTSKEAIILKGWANEYGLYSAIHEPHYNRSGYYSTRWHLNLGSRHYPIIDPWNLGLRQ